MKEEGKRNESSIVLLRVGEGTQEVEKEEAKQSPLS